MFAENFKTDNGYLTDFNQINKKKQTPLSFSLEHLINFPQMYDILFEKTDLSCVTDFHLYKIIEEPLFNYNNNLSQKFVDNFDKLGIPNMDTHISIIRAYNTTLSNTIFLYDKEVVDYHRDCLKQYILNIFSHTEKNNFVFMPKQNLLLFLAFEVLDINSQKDQQIILKLNLNFEFELKRFLSLSSINIKNPSSFEQRFDAYKILQEKYRLNGNITENNILNIDNQKNIFKI